MQIKRLHTQTHLGFVLPLLHAPVSRGPTERLQLLPHGLQPFIQAQHEVVEALVLLNAVLTLAHSHLGQEGKEQREPSLKLLPDGTFASSSFFVPLPASLLF